MAACRLNLKELTGSGTGRFVLTSLLGSDMNVPMSSMGTFWNKCAGGLSPTGGTTAVPRPVLAAVHTADRRECYDTSHVRRTLSPDSRLHPPSLLPIWICPAQYAECGQSFMTDDLWPARKDGEGWKHTQSPRGKLPVTIKGITQMV